MNDQIDEAEWQSFDQKKLSWIVDPTKLATLEDSSFVCAFAKKRQFCWVSKCVSENEPSN
jgi:hypothetical protein